MRGVKRIYIKFSLILLLIAVAVNNCFAAGNESVLETADKSTETLLSLLIKGGPVMIPLLICSIVALTITIERFTSLRKTKVIPAGFSLKLKENLNKCTIEDYNKTIEYCNSAPSPMSNIIKAGIARCKAKRDLDEVEEAMEDIAGREIRGLKGSLQGLKIVAAISPLLGLLGTVYGMITAFQSVANTTVGVAKAERLAEGIYEAMVTTAVGLTIAIPVMLLYYFLTYKVDRYMNDVEKNCDSFIDIFIENNSQK